jgi:molybdenum cofactor synthesis domain-containing protein
MEHTMRKIPLEEAVGQRLGHDLTEIDPLKKLKHRLFKRGHRISTEDVERLRNIGKNHVYIWEDDDGAVHEDEAALIVAPLAAGDNITFDAAPSEGKISFYATCDGLFQVDIARLYRINALEIPSLPTLHHRFPVKKGQQVAAFRIIPLFCERELMDSVRSILSEPLFRVQPYRMKNAAIIVTGSEIFEGRIKDGFKPKIKRILKPFGVKVVWTQILPDDREQIRRAVEQACDECEIVFVTGGTSVDPDDQTVAALVDAGVEHAMKGNPIQPGNNFTIGYRGEVAICAIPAAALYFKATALNVFLPRLLAGERIPKEDLIRAGHGGLCHFCKVCRFPICPLAAGK